MSDLRNIDEGAEMKKPEAIDLSRALALVEKRRVASGLGDLILPPKQPSTDICKQ